MIAQSDSTEIPVPSDGPGPVAHDDSELILLTGASGFVGGHLAAKLVADGRRVRCLVRPTSDITRLRALVAARQGPGVELVLGDLTDSASLARATADCTQVVHSAAMVSDWGTVAEIRAANVTGTADLAAAAVANGVRRFVQISTTDVYGYPGTPGLTEDFVPVGFANWYSQSKREAETALNSLAAETDLEVVFLRPATVYGPGSTEVIGEMTRAMRSRYLPAVAGGRPVAGLVHVENLVDAVLLALSCPEAAGEAFNVVDGLDVTWREFLGGIGTELGYPLPWIRLNYRLAFHIAVFLEEGYRALRRLTGLRTAPLLTRAAVQILGVDQDFSNLKLQTVLGWQPRVGYGEGLAATVAWLRDEYLPAR
jgi:nucleoside-diphosphate-sugar epimerase